MHAVRHWKVCFRAVERRVRGMFARGVHARHQRRAMREMSDGFLRQRQWYAIVRPVRVKCYDEHGWLVVVRRQDGSCAQGESRRILRRRCVWHFVSSNERILIRFCAQRRARRERQ